MVRIGRGWLAIIVFFGVFFLCGAFSSGAIIGIIIGQGAGDQVTEGVALIPIDGTILEGDTASGLLSSDAAYSYHIIRLLRRAQQDERVKAVVLRINSPGGGVVASEQIYREVLRTREAGKPVVASMSTLAASGGYYVSAGADRIVAHHGTITGSIGVIGTYPRMDELLDNLGIEMIVIKSGPQKDIGSSFREMSPEERQILQSMIDESYEQFIRVVAEGRGLDLERVRQIADGRIYSGQQAHTLGLVDELGDFETALMVAGELADIEGRPSVIEYERPGLWRGLFSYAEAMLSSGRITDISVDRMLGIERRFMVKYLYIG